MKRWASIWLLILFAVLWRADVHAPISTPLKKNIPAPVVKPRAEQDYAFQINPGSKNFSAYNSAQSISAHIQAGQLQLNGESNTCKWQQKLELKAISFDEQALLQASANPGKSLCENELVYHHQGFDEQYINTSDGIRQNFIIHQDPGFKARTLKISLTTAGHMLAIPTDSFSLSFINAEGKTIFRYHDIHAWDARHKTIPAYIESNQGNINLVADISDATYPLTIDPVSSSPVSTLDNNSNGSLMGVSVAPAGDVNGDGYSDLIVGAFAYSNGQTYEGAAYVYHGSSTGISSSPSWSFEANQAEAYLGKSVSTAGDINKDGYSDIVVSAHGYDNGQTNEGRIYVFMGSASGISNSGFWQFESDQAFSYLGEPLACAGDVNGDGYSDIIAGLAGYSNGNLNEGAAYAFYGSASGLSSSPDWIKESNIDSAMFGAAVASAADVNADGYDDVIIGAHRYSNGQHREGIVYVFHGSSSGLLSTASWSFESDNQGANLGKAVSAAGDVNGDGYADVIAGAYYYSNGEQFEGAAWIFHGSASGLSGTAAWKLESDQAGAGFGTYVSCAGDVNADGYADVIVGAYSYDNGQTDEGAAFLYLGSASGVSTSSSWSGEGNQDSAYYGRSVCCAGDLNGDGFSDIAVGAYFYDNGHHDEGAVFIYPGSANNLSNTAQVLENNSAGVRLGYQVAAAGDVNGDGYEDVLSAAPYYSNGQNQEGIVYLYYGTANGLGSMSWSYESNQDNAFLGSSLAAAGDVNADGYADVLIGAYGYSNGQSNEGAAMLFLGSASGLSSSPSWLRESNQAGATFGAAVSTAGDVNADGFSDLLIAAPVYSNGQSQEGAVFIYYGSPGGPDTVAGWSTESNQAGANLGSAVATAGDVNGDGYSDILIAASGYDNGQSNEGKVFLYHGQAAGPGSLPAWSVESNQAGAGLGSVASAGDVNGDGFSDVITGMQAYSNGQNAEGAAWLFHGSVSGLGSSPAWTYESDLANAQLGFSVSSAADPNGDGYSDVLIGAPAYSNGQNQEGKVYIFYGSSTGTGTNPGWTYESNSIAAQCGYSVASGTDVNGDGFSDIITGAPTYSNPQLNEGALFLFYGNRGNGLRNQLRLYNNDLSTLINYTAYSQSQFGIGVYGRDFMGRAKVRLQWEIKANGQPFSGNPISNSVSYTARQSSYTQLGTGVGQLKNVVSKSSGMSNKIRARLQYNMASSLTGQSFGPWRYLSSYNSGQLANNNTPLPLQLLSFEVSWLEPGRSARLEWSSIHERNCSQFIVQRSSDARNWSNVQALQASGTSAIQQQYLHIDKTIERFRQPVMYYRLQILDNDGAFMYSPLRILKRATEDDALISISPNPVGSSFRLHRTQDNAESLQISLSNALGIVLIQYYLKAYEHNSSISLELLPAGTYFLHVESASSEQLLKLIKP